MRKHRFFTAFLLLLVATLMTPGRVVADPGEPATLQARLLPVVTAQMAAMGIPGLIVSVQTPDGDSWQAALGSPTSPPAPRWTLPRTSESAASPSH